MKRTPGHFFLLKGIMVLCFLLFFTSGFLGQGISFAEKIAISERKTPVQYHNLNAAIEYLEQMEGYTNREVLKLGVLLISGSIYFDDAMDNAETGLYEHGGPSSPIYIPGKYLRAGDQNPDKLFSREEDLAKIIYLARALYHEVIHAQQGWDKRRRCMLWGTLGKIEYEAWLATFFALKNWSNTIEDKLRFERNREYGYDFIKTVEELNILYDNLLFLPTGFTDEGYITREEMERHLGCSINEWEKQYTKIKSALNTIIVISQQGIMDQNGFFDWVRKVAGEMDRQIYNRQLKIDAFTALGEQMKKEVRKKAGEIDANMKKLIVYGSTGKASLGDICKDYKDMVAKDVERVCGFIDEIISSASGYAKDGVIVARFTTDDPGTRKILEVRRLLLECNRYQVPDIGEYQKKYEQIKKQWEDTRRICFDRNTPSLLKRRHPSEMNKAFQDAIYDEKWNVMIAFNTGRSIDSLCDQIIAALSQKLAEAEKAKKEAESKKTAQKPEESTEGGRILPTEIWFSLKTGKLAIDDLTSVLTRLPQEGIFTCQVFGAKVKRDECKHMKSVPVQGKDKDGNPTTIYRQAVDFSHPVDRVSEYEGSGASASRIKPDGKPSITAAPSGIVVIDENKQKIIPAQCGTVKITAKTQGVTGKKKSDNRCNLAGNSLIEIGEIQSVPGSIEVVGIQEVSYTYSENDYFFRTHSNQPPKQKIPHIYSSITLTDNNTFTSLAHIEVKTGGGLHYLETPSGESYGEVSGTGEVAVSAYLKDSRGEEYYKRLVNKFTMNSVEEIYTDSIPAGETGEVKVVVKGGADMGKYYCQWKPSKASRQIGLYKPLAPAISGEKTFFQRTGPDTWESVNRFSFPVKFFRENGLLDHAVGDLGMEIVKRGEGKEKLISCYYRLYALPPRLNQLSIHARRGQEKGEAYRAFYYDLFSGIESPQLEVYPVGLFGNKKEDTGAFQDILYHKWVKWDIEGVARGYIQDLPSGAQSALKDIPFIIHQGVTRIPYLNTKDDNNCLYLKIHDVNKPGKTALKATVSSGALFDRMTLFENLASIQSINALTITTNVLRIEPVERDGNTFYRLIVDGPAIMDAYEVQWSLYSKTDPSFTQKAGFQKSEEDGQWFSEIARKERLQRIEAEVVNSDMLVVGKAAREIAAEVTISSEKDSGTKIDVVRQLREIMVTLFTAYEREDESTFMEWVSPEFQSVDNSGFSYNKSQLRLSLGNDFRNLNGIEFKIDADPPVGGPYHPKVEMRWSRRAIVALSGQEWVLRNKFSVLSFSYDHAQNKYLLNSIQGDPILGLSSSSGKITVPKGSEIEGTKIGEDSLIDEGRICSESLPGSLSVTHIDPATGIQGAQDMVVYVYGSAFQDGVNITLQGPGNITVKHILVLSPTVLKATLDIAGNAPTGPYNIVVTDQSGGKSTLSNAFIVKEAEGVRIDSIEPNTIKRGQDLSGKIHGYHFTLLPKYPRIVLRLHSDPNKEIRIREAEVTSDTLIQFWESIDGNATAGMYDIVVWDKDDNEIIKANAIEIQP